MSQVRCLNVFFTPFHLELLTAIKFLVNYKCVKNMTADVYAVASEDKLVKVTCLQVEDHLFFVPSPSEKQRITPQSTWSKPFILQSHCDQKKKKTYLEAPWDVNLPICQTAFWKL